MTFETVGRRTVAGLGVFLVTVLSLAVAGDKGDKKDKPSGSQKVDSGSFGIFIKGQRVATETFSIEQQDSNSTIKSQLKETSGPASQKSDLEITSSGELVHYEWSQGTAGSITVLPKDDFLLERISTANYTKPAEQSFLLPNTSAILDNNFFVHREVLAWRYLAANCKPQSEGMKCQNAPGDFGVLVPQDRTSMHVRLQFMGKEKVPFRGAERELLKLNLTGENYEWTLWLDDLDHFKLMKVTIAADNTEIVRD